MVTTLMTRSAEDIADAVLDYAEIKALAMGNPLLKTRVEIAGRLERAKRNKQQRIEDIKELRSYLAQASTKAKKLSARQRGAEKDQKNYERERRAISREVRATFGDRLLCALCQHVQAEEEARKMQ